MRILSTYVRFRRAVKLHERVQVHVEGSGGLPLEFSWRGRRHRVRAVLEGPGRERSRFIVRTASGMRCTLAHEPDPRAWRIERVR